MSVFFQLKNLFFFFFFDDYTFLANFRWTREGNPLPVTDFDFKDMESIKTILTEQELTEFHPKPALLKKGEASFHHPLAVHGSYGNRSAVQRRATVLNFFADGVKSASDGDLIGGAHVAKVSGLSMLKH